MDVNTWTHVDDLAEERQITVKALQYLCGAAKVTIPKHGRLSPRAWKRLDGWIYRHYGVAAGQPLPRL